VESVVTVIVGAPSSVLASPSVTDIVDANPAVSNDAPNSFSLGTTVVTWTAVDASGNSATATTTVTAVYNFVGLYSPIGKQSYKAGSTIPVKFQLLDYYGNYVSAAKAQVWVDSKAGTASGNSNTGNNCRYDTTENQYIFNLSTKGMTVGSHTVSVTLDDGTSYQTDILLK
jgi:hypothetical protein